MADKAKTQEFDSPSGEQDKSSSKVGWLATLAILSLVGLVVWFFVLNSSDEA